MSRTGDMDGRSEKGMFVKGHKHSPETLEKIRIKNTGKKHSVPCWMKGLTKETDERIAKMAATKRRKKFAPRPHRQGIRVSVATEFKKGIVPVGGITTRFKCGEEHPLWKGGVSGEHATIRHSSKYKKWRDAVYWRDLFICQHCHKHCERKDIVAHHIKSFSTYENLRFVAENGITLCRSCHIILHKQEDERYAPNGRITESNRIAV